jgi:putative spermidine/putrescine transport system ATP-binding protein
VTVAAVALRSVAKNYGQAAAVDGVSLDIASGEFVTLLGPSGCGKTTTLRLIAGLIIPDRGSVEIGGRDVTRVPVHQRNIGMVFQSHALFPHMTIADNVAFGLKMRGVDRAERNERVRAVLALVRLSEYGQRVPSQLSGGQQQRVALARALVFQPDVLLLDEPFGALDRKLREAMQTELRELTRKIGITAIFVTHDQEEALILSDHIAVMNGGKIEQVGTPDAIFEQPTTHFVADFMGFGNIFQGVVSAIADRHVTIKVDRLRVDAVHARGAKAGQPIKIAIRPERVSIAPLSSESPGDGAGTVEARTYQGVVCTYQVRLDQLSGASLLVREPALGSEQFRFPVGARVKTTWPVAAVRLISD